MTSFIRVKKKTHCSLRERPTQRQLLPASSHWPKQIKAHIRILRWTLRHVQREQTLSPKRAGDSTTSKASGKGNTHANNVAQCGQAPQRSLTRRGQRHPNAETYHEPRAKPSSPFKRRTAPASKNSKKSKTTHKKTPPPEHREPSRVEILSQTNRRQKDTQDSPNTTKHACGFCHRRTWPDHVRFTSCGLHDNKHVAETLRQSGRSIARRVVSEHREDPTAREMTSRNKASELVWMGHLSAREVPEIYTHGGGKRRMAERHAMRRKRKHVT